LRLGRVGSILWLFRQYFFKFSAYAVILVTLLFAGKRVLSEIPNILVKSLVGNSGAKIDMNKQDNVTQPKQVTASGDSQMHHIHIDSAGSSAPLSAVYDDPTTDDIIGFVPGGVITKKGILKQDDHIIYKNDRDYVKRVDVMRGILYLGSGNKVQK
jgi:hypothetical protein